ncbi:MAG: bifunctional oligoribonuclease/PAP phosphatase NrnA [Bacteroidales bacterium]|nr:bifunctional oligoribonuclease/PAP phosphatase NrnA [Bacteroidales bacterium]
MKQNIDRFEEHLRGKKRVLAVGHFHPDGDATGAVVAMARFLESIGIECSIVLPSPIPSYLDFLDPRKSILFYTQDRERADRLILESDLIICLDFNSLSRTEDMEKTLKESKAPKILIDHHLNPVTEEFSLIFSDPSASATCELLWRVLMNTSFTHGDICTLPQEANIALAAGILADTNNFSNSVTPDTFTMASQLLHSGIDLAELNDRLFKHFSENRLKMLGELLTQSMVFHPHINACSMILSQQTKRSFDYKEGDTEGFVNIPLSVRDVEVSALFTESDGYVKVSLRSKGGVSVNALSAQYFNGGGHERAAGGKIYLPLEEVRGYFERSLEQFLREHK